MYVVLSYVPLQPTYYKRKTIIEFPHGYIDGYPKTVR